MIGGMFRWLVVALTVAGCDRAFGLSGLDEPQPVTGKLVHRDVMNDDRFLPIVVERVIPRELLSFVVTLDDGTRPDVEYLDDGSFSFTRATSDQPYRLAFASEALRGETWTALRELTIGFITAGHYDRRPQQTARVEFAFPIAGAATSQAHIASTGIYTFASTAQYGPLVSFDWRLASPAPGGLTGMLDASEHDQLYALELEPITAFNSSAFSRIRAVSSASVSLTPNGVTTLPQPAAVIANSCAHVTAANSREHARLTAAAPRTYTASSSNWILYATPSPERLSLVGALYPAICGMAGTPDIDILPEFHDPYPGTTLLASTTIAASFEVQAAGAKPMLLSNSSRVDALAMRGSPGDCTVPPTVLAATVGIPGNYVLGGTLLATDGQILALDRTSQVEIAWSLGESGPADIHVVSLQELVDIDGQTYNVGRWAASTVGQTFARIEPALLEPGHTYLIAVTASVGRPNLDTGDYLTFGLPAESATVWSSTFVVEDGGSTRRQTR